MKKNAHLDRTVSKKCANCGAVFYRDKRCTYAHWGRAKFCSRNCSGIHCAKVHYAKGPTITERIQEKSVVLDSGCRIWTGPTNGKYGVISFMGKSTYVHRVSLSQKLGRKIKPGHLACHTCDNPLCTNPDHIYEGTYASNSKDMCVRQRVWWRKLTVDQVHAIRASSLSYAELARKYNVSETTISKISKRQSWRHV